MKRGLVLGKFIPPTIGHGSLVEFGIQFMRNVNTINIGQSGLSVLVGTRPNEPILGHLRYLAMHEAFGAAATIYHFSNTLPEAPENDADEFFWHRWTSAIQQKFQEFEKFDYVFASENYGKRLAECLGAKFIPVDIGRRSIPISATIVRNAVFDNWDYILPTFRKNYVKRIAIVGPESCGKTTLARNLASYFKTEWVPEWARGYLEAENNRYPIDSDYSLIAEAHAASENSLANYANKVLISDTDAVCTAIAARRLNNIIYDPVVEKHCTERNYDLRIIMQDDVPFVVDPLRYGVDQRQFDTMQFHHEYANRGIKNVIVIGGSWEKRFNEAVVAIQNCMNNRNLS